MFEIRTLIGWECKCSNVFSGPVLIDRESFFVSAVCSSLERFSFFVYKSYSFLCVLVCNGCVDGRGETPVPIPNTEVKPSSGDGTAVLTVGE